MRLDKYLAHAGMGTRKEVKQLIRKGQVYVNNQICTKDDVHIDEVNDEIMVQGERITYLDKVYIMMNKPSNVLCATKDHAQPTIMDLIQEPIPKDCFPVGRLDRDSEGLLLICNDGGLAHDLLTPKKHIEKTYYVEIEHKLSTEDIEILESGTIVLDNATLQKASVEILNEKAMKLTIQEGKYHQVKRMLTAVHNSVCFLKRISMGSLTLDETLQPGEWRYLSEEELTNLKKSGG